MGGKSKHLRLRLIRRRKGLSQKQVARLLHHRATNEISVYELGKQLPNLHSALKLQIIYGVPVATLFVELYEQLLQEVTEQARVSGLTALFEKHRARNFCSYLESLDAESPSEETINDARRHAIELTNTLRDAIAARNKES
jgi:transcriptional regulator with XRE-family HTH domain